MLRRPHSAALGRTETAIVPMLFSCGLLLVWQEALGGLAHLLGRPVARRERLAWSLLVVAFLLPWASGRTLFLPVDETVARNLPGAPSVESPDRHGLYNDVVLQLYPWELEVRRAFGEGRLPFWSDTLDGGSSPWTNPQAAVLAPTALLARAAPPASVFLLHFALKILTAALGTLLLARSVGLRPTGRRMAALAVALGGGLAAWSMFPLGTVVAWTPWLGAAGVAMARRPGRRTLLGGALVAAAALLSGHPEAALGAAALGFGAAAAALRGGFAWPRLVRAWAASALFWCAGAALAAPAVLPQAAQVLHSLRAERAVERESAAAPAARLGLLAAPLGPRIFGRAFHEPNRGPLPWPVLGSCYVGVLALVGLPAAWWAPRRRLVGLFVGAAFAIYLLAAEAPPLAGLLRRTPWVQAIAFTRWLPAAGILLALAGACGLETIRRRGPQWRMAAAAALVAAVALAALARAWPMAAVPVLGGLGLWRRDRRGAWLLLAAVAIDVGPWAWDYFPRGHAALFYPETDCTRLLVDEAKARPDARVTAAGFQVYPSLLPVYGLSEVRVNNPAADADTLRFLGAALGFRPETTRYKGALRGLDGPALSFLGVDRMLVGGAEPTPAGWTRNATAACAPLAVLENPAALPRWFVPSAVDAVADAQAAAWIQAWSDPRRTFVSPETRTALPASLPAEDRAVRSRGGDGRVTLELADGPPALLASSVPFSNGWQATSAGRDVATVRLLGAYLGLVAEPGMTSIALRYRPPGLAAGVALCAAALVGLGLPWMRAWRRRP